MRTRASRDEDTIRTTVENLMPREASLSRQEVDSMVELCATVIVPRRKEDFKKLMRSVPTRILDTLHGVRHSLSRVPIFRNAINLFLVEWCWRYGLLFKDWSWNWSSESEGELTYDSNPIADKIIECRIGSLALN